jgi:hypothetical protein
MATEVARPLEADALGYERRAFGGEHFLVALRASMDGEK